MKNLILAVVLILLIYVAGGIFRYYFPTKSNERSSPQEQTTVNVAEEPKMSLVKDIDLLELWQLTNKARTDNELPALSLDPKLNASALDKCNDMVFRDYWSHKTPEGTEPWAFIRKYATFDQAGENLASNIYSAEQTVDNWMNSKTHKDNILKSRFVSVGFGVCKSENYIGKGPQLIVVQHFTD